MSTKEFGLSYFLLVKSPISYECSIKPYWQALEHSSIFCKTTFLNLSKGTALLDSFDTRMSATVLVW